ncbi:gp53-like domain-containing protein [Sphingobium sp. EP60837]|uniref:gp53-like domain-containing protein n=1 Tax=Sphingobium sp. EP60837 TaxID=1855519 RepID=UPI0007DDED9F|nr:hypothetical protein [Sphingobium sp. EP60837]ANI79002.1 hypothetical protein EP837_02607 [Sphingobium sp. EP60837]
MAVSDWSTTAADNGTVGAVNIAEGCPSANLNNAVREVMAQVKTFTDALPDAYQYKDPLLTALAALTTSANQVIYATGPDTFAVTALTAFIRTLLDDADGQAACLTLGAVRVAALSIANPGYVRLQVGASSYVQFAWGTFTCPANSSATVNYAGSFPNASFPICSGSDGNPGGQDNLPAVTGGSATKDGFTAYNAANGAVSGYYIAAGY